MNFLDLHIHSSFSISTARNMSISMLAQTAKEKGLTAIASGDCLHPQWNMHLRENITEINQSGVFCCKTIPEVKIILQTEISFIFRRDLRCHRIHIIFLFKNFATVEKLARKICGFANLKSDGRPVLKINPYDFIADYIDIPETMVIPAHIWTPWYSLFGSKSGFDSMKDLFKDLVAQITALETGLSADPDMCGLVDELDRFSLISCSDAHSPDSLGREFIEIDCLESFEQLKKIFETKKINRTFEYFPQEGKYYFDGHRKCGFSSSPEETKQLRGICPECKKPLTRGVLSRVMELANDKKIYQRNFDYHIPLKQIIAYAYKVRPESIKTATLYKQLVNEYETEINCLHFVPIAEIAKHDLSVAELIARMRKREICWQEGYDGRFGKILY